MPSSIPRAVRKMQADSCQRWEEGKRKERKDGKGKGLCVLCVEKRCARGAGGKWMGWSKEWIFLGEGLTKEARTGGMLAP